MGVSGISEAGKMACIISWEIIPRTQNDGWIEQSALPFVTDIFPTFRENGKEQDRNEQSGKRQIDKE